MSSTAFSADAIHAAAAEAHLPSRSAHVSIADERLADHPFLPLLDRLHGPAPRLRDAHGLRDGDALRAEIDACAAAMRASGAQRIASRLDNGGDWVVLDLAIRMLGLVHVPLPTFFSEDQIAHALRDSGADALVCIAAHIAAHASPHTIAPDAAAHEAAVEQGTHALGPRLRLQPLTAAEVALPAGTAVITYTSGTTGTPKGVCLDAATLMTVAQSLADAAAPLSPQRHLCLMPLSTLLENVAGVYAALLADAEIVAPSLAEIGYTGAAGLDVPTLIACLHRHRPHSAILVPQLLLALTMAAERGVALPDSLRFLAVGGARVGESLIARADAVGLPVYEGYGLSECGSVVCLNRPGARRAGSVGRALPHVRVQVGEGTHAGELLVDGPRWLGYLGDAPPPAGPVATGDLGYIDVDGYVYVTGRKKHVFITAFGRNVSPEWVESELQQHPDIAQAVVFGEARPFNVAVVWPRRAEADTTALQAALDAVNRRLPDYAQVRVAIRADAPFSSADGTLTANGRPRREAIFARHRSAIDAQYAPSLAASTDALTDTSIEASIEASMDTTPISQRHPHGVTA